MLVEIIYLQTNIKSEVEENSAPLLLSDISECPEGISETMQLSQSLPWLFWHTFSQIYFPLHHFPE